MAKTPPRPRQAIAPPKRKPEPLKVDAEKFPSLSRFPSLERALRIRQALDKGLPRDEAVQVADDAMGRITRSEAPAASRGRPRPAGGASRGGKAGARPTAPGVKRRS